MQQSLSISCGEYLDIRSIFMRTLPAQPCLLCGALSHDGVWCTACNHDLPRLTAAHCPICALPTVHGETCGHCLKKMPPFDHTVAAFTYDFPIDKLIGALKFNERLNLVNSLADALATQIEFRADCLVAMPLHPMRLRERGFNQSLLLARRIARSLNIPLLVNACQRTRNTTPQSTLPWKERDKNMRDAFSCSTDFEGKHVAIVDDVLTTGASVGELAKVLRHHGAKEISAWVVARTLP